ncbi:MAG: hypothetical protein SFV55_23940 [Haliscomenobacter sp.]|uniref:hypothetical protein n=1 Tax=Haliscomenobacter sp. TaxID=2717303 RepID=UPI0029AD2AF3|nr:hypothetical protein [Haliscomenobacter sp.]MDX2071502.1 hypothetical protein [Haliscomenobacter sp.]
MQRFYPGALSLFLVISLISCQVSPKLENLVPSSALALLTTQENRRDLPFPKLEWSTVLMPLSKTRTGLLYISTDQTELQITKNKGLKRITPTQWRGVQFEHIEDSNEQKWVLAQIKKVKYLAREAELVEEAALAFKEKKRAPWITAPLPNQLQFNYSALSDFWGLKGDALAAHCKSVSLDLGTETEPLQGRLDFLNSPNIKEKDLTGMLAIAPGSARSVIPYFGTDPVLTRLKAGTTFSLHFGRGKIRQTALIVPFASHQLAQTALHELAEHYGALAPLNYQTYTLQPVLDIGLNALNIRQASLCVFERFLVIGASENLMERWIDAVVVGNTIAKQLRTPPSGLWMRLSTDHDLGFLIDQLHQTFKLQLPLPDPLQWEGPITGEHWAFQDAPNLESIEQATAEIWQMDLPQGKAKQLWAIEDWNQFLIESDELHLLSLGPEGNIQWDKKLESSLVGPLTAVARPELGQTLVYFSTEKAIHALQSDGQEAPGFPLALNLPISSGISVGGLEQFLFYSSSDGRLYGMDKNGQPLSGWNPGPKIGPVKQALAYFQSATEDYLLALTEMGKFHVLDRSSQPHFPAKTLKGPFASPPQWQWDEMSQRIVVADGKGKAQVFTEKGESFSLSITAGLAGATRFCFADLIGDGRKDYLTANGAQLFLHAYNQDDGFQLVFKKSFEGQIDGLTASGQKENALIICGIPGDHQVWCLTAKGETVQGFPVAGDHFAFFPEQKIMVTTIDNRVYAYVL